MPGIGDPGLFGTIGGLIGKVASVAKVIPGPIGWAGAAVSRVIGSSQPVPPPVRSFAPVAPPTPFAPMQLPQQPTPGIVGFMQRGVPGGQPGYEDVPAIGSPAGYHVNKTSYFLKDGTFIPEGSRWVKNRHRNPLNPRAASRAIGRLESLKKATARFSRITIRKKCCKK